MTGQNLTFTHNFCESRLNNNMPPEIINSISALYMVFLPFIFGFPNNGLFFNIAVLLQFNGFASCYYHYTLNWIGKQMDEISMILANYFGLWSLFKIYYRKNNNKINYYNRINLIYMTLFIAINTITYMDLAFPFLFGFYIGYTTYMIHLISNMFNFKYKKYMTISLFGAIYWLISEICCNSWTYLGHSAWHILFPTGFYKLILQYDRKNII